MGRVQRQGQKREVVGEDPGDPRVGGRAGDGAGGGGGRRGG